jgi:hypothetical protein
MENNSIPEEDFSVFSGSRVQKIKLIIAMTVCLAPISIILLVRRVQRAIGDGAWVEVAPQRRQTSHEKNT